MRLIRASRELTLQDVVLHVSVANGFGDEVPADLGFVEGYGNVARGASAALGSVLDFAQAGGTQTVAICALIDVDGARDIIAYWAAG